MDKIGFIGLGSQGGPMALRILQAGFPLTVWARKPPALESLVAQGATAASSVEQLGAACDHVALCVVNDAGVFELCEKLIPAMRPGSRLVVHSTILPESCLTLAARCKAREIAFVDAPVSGGGPAAASGELTVMCGAPEAVFESAKPVFATFGKLVVRLGDVGAGQRAKIVNNALMTANMASAQAALAAGEALGLARAELASLLKQSSGRSFALEVFARLPTPGAFAHGAAMLRKDVELLRSIAAGDENAEMLAILAQRFLVSVDRA